MTDDPLYDDYVAEALVASADAINKTPKQRKTALAKPASGKALPLTEVELFGNFVDRSGLALKRDGRVYLKAEAWQYIMSLKKLRVMVTCTTETLVDPDVFRVHCTATVYRNELGPNGEQVVDTSGTMMASSDEKFLADKPAYAVYGLAETRAIARALRNKYGYLAVACGFEAVPWEEVNG